MFGVDLTAPVVPGKSAAGFSLGNSVASLKVAFPNMVPESLGAGSSVYRFDSVRVWIEGGRISQVCVAEKYGGTIAGTKLGIGSTIEAVQDALGPVIEDECDNLVVEGPAGRGWSFDTAHWRFSHHLADNLQARIVVICVFQEESRTDRARRLTARR